MGKKRVRVLRLDWDAEYYFDMYTGNGFTITEPVAISLDGSKQKTMYGPQSPLYGTTYGDDQAFIERYRCKCGKYKSRLFEGEVCPYCHTKVEYRGSDINTTGWISLGDNRIISPFYYRVLQGALGKTVFSDIVFAKFKVTKDGHKVRPSEDEFEGKPSSPYAGIGVDAFYENYENIMEYFKSIKKSKADTIDLLIKQKSSVFVSHIPILSTLLRPQSITSDTFYYNAIDKTINPLFSLSEHIKDDIPIERDLTLARLQTTVNELWDIIFTEVNGKDGHIRGEMLGGSLNYTSRNVICPAPDLHDDEIDISYHTFLEVFKYKIIYYIMKMDDVSMSTAYSEWKASSKYNEKMHEIMQYMIQREDIRVLINRNPTLNYYSMLLMKIRQVKPDGGDYALSVPLSILPGQL